MRARFVLASVLAPIVAVIAGCPVVPRDAAFSCGDGRCPEGFECVEGLCRTPGHASMRDAWSADLDASVDVGPTPDTGPRPDSGPIDAGRTDAGSEELGCLALGLDLRSSETITVTGSEDVFEAVGITISAGAEEVWAPIAWNGTLTNGSGNQASDSNDGAVLRVTPTLGVTTGASVFGAGSQTLRQITFLGGTLVYAGSTDADALFSDTRTAVVSGPASFVHVEGGATKVFGGYMDTVDVSTYDLVAVSATRFCVAGVAIGRLNSTINPGEAGFVHCANMDMSDPSTAVVDGEGGDSVTSLAVGAGGVLYVGGTVTRNGVPPGSSSMVALDPGSSGVAYIVRTDSNLSGSGRVFTFGADGTAETQRSTVHDLVTTAEGVYFVGRLGTGSSPGFPTVTVGFDAVAGHLSFGATPSLDWVQTHHDDVVDEYLRAATDSCGNLIAVGGVGAADLADIVSHVQSRPIVTVYTRGGTEAQREVGEPGAFLRGVSVLSDDQLYLFGRWTTPAGSLFGVVSETGFEDLFVFHVN